MDTMKTSNRAGQHNWQTEVEARCHGSTKIMHCPFSSEVFLCSDGMVLRWETIFMMVLDFQPIGWVVTSYFLQVSLLVGMAFSPNSWVIYYYGLKNSTSRDKAEVLLDYLSLTLLLLYSNPQKGVITSSVWWAYFQIFLLAFLNTDIQTCVHTFIDRHTHTHWEKNMKFKKMWQC